MEGHKGKRQSNKVLQPNWVDANLMIGGGFDFVKGRVEYVGGQMFVKLNLWVDELNVESLRREVLTAMGRLYNKRHEHFSMWYSQKGRNLTASRELLKTDDDVRSLVECRDKYNRVTVYVVLEKSPPVSPRRGYRSKNLHFPTASEVEGINKPKVKSEPNTSGKSSVVISPTRRSPRFSYDVIDGEIIITDENWMEIGGGTDFQCSQTDLPPPKYLESQKNLSSVSTLQPPPNTDKVTKFKPSTTIPRTVVTQTDPPPKDIPSSSKTATKIKEQNPVKRKSKGKKKCVDDEEDWSGDEAWSGESSSSGETDLEFDPEEEDKHDEENRVEELRLSQGNRSQFEGVEGSRSQFEGVEGSRSQFEGVEEVNYDSNELRSIHGSDDEEVVQYPIFNPATYFKERITLTQGLKFGSIKDLRKAILQHSVENNYNFYYLHNGSKRLTAYCRKRCDCPWDKQHGVIVNCKCKKKYNCKFRIFAAKVKGEETMQIKSLNLKHNNCYEDANPKLTSQFLAEKYLDLWRSEPTLSLKTFIHLVERDFNVKIEYFKAWYARARAKLMLYGDCSEEYAKVHDYGHAIL